MRSSVGFFQQHMDLPQLLAFSYATSSMGAKAETPERMIDYIQGSV